MAGYPFSYAMSSIVTSPGEEPHAMADGKPPFPPFDEKGVRQKVQSAEDA